jgi:SAM-dependent methyltransferase
MTDNFGRFTGRAAVYVKYRERYDPQIVLRVLREWCGLTADWLIADVGAGTGMLSDVFLENGNRVLAIEPNPEMRAACIELHHGDPQLQVMDGAAEATGLADSLVDAVAAGRALHWFAIEPAMREFRRVLKPDGWVFVIAFGRAEEGREENLRFRDLMWSFATDAADTRALCNVYSQIDQNFVGGEFHHARISGEMQVNWDSLLGLAISMSPVPSPDSARYPEFEKALRQYFDGYQRNGVVTLTTGYWINAGRFPR